MADNGRPKIARANRRLARAVGRPALPAVKQISHAQRNAEWISCVTRAGIVSVSLQAEVAAGGDRWSLITSDSDATELGTELWWVIYGKE